MKALVTGAHGFIGSHLVDRLLADGAAVRALVSPWGTLDNLGEVEDRPGLEVVRGDITRPETLAGAAEGCELVYHAAARVADWGPWREFSRTNVEGTKNVLAEAGRASVRRFVHVSSVAVHRYTGFRDADPLQIPRGDAGLVAYARSKVLAEEAVAQSGLEFCLARPGLWPFGPRDPNFPKVVGPLRAGKLPLVRGGRCVINTAYVENLAHGLARAGTSPRAAGRTYVIADEGMPTWAEIFGYIAELLQAPAPGPSLPGLLSRAAGSAVEGLWAVFRPGREPPLTTYRGALMCRDVHFSIAAAKDELGYSPAVEWREGIRRTLAALGFSA